jgi:exosortase/archaeosortase family protein
MSTAVYNALPTPASPPEGRINGGWARALGTIAIAAAAYSLMVDVARDLEGRLVFGVAAALFHKVQVLASATVAFAFAGSCSSALTVAALVGIGLFIVRTSWQRWLAGMSAAIATVVLINGVRVIGTVWFGTVAKRSTLILVHDWIGAPLTILAGLAAVLVLLRVTTGTRAPRVQS